MFKKTKYYYKKYNKFFHFLFIFFILSFAPAAVTAAESSDAIAIRVIPNPNHYSAFRWYSMQGFSGSPQDLEVDGYQAVRDGRSVYVSASNVANSSLYTNIYILSYNQTANQDTLDIFSQILTHWKFNANLTLYGQCNHMATGTIQSTKDKCFVDSDCQLSQFCNSPKSKIVRDTRRLSDMAELKILLQDYKNKNGFYPSLKAGSYLPYKTVSTWPSWQATFGKTLGVTLSVDPINHLGSCPNHDPITCWNNADKHFADANPLDPVLDLPSGSQAYVYNALNDGEQYDICGAMESSYINIGSGGKCPIN